MRHTMRWILAAMVMMMCGTVHAATTGPATRPKKLGAVPEIPDVTSIKDLKAAPAFQIKGWQVRLGLASGGADAEGWMILYCLADPADGARFPNRIIGEALGPVSYEVVPPGQRMEQMQDELVAQLDRLRQTLFFVAIPLHSAEGYILRVFAGADDRIVLAERKLPARKGDWFWTSLCSGDNKVAEDASAAMPRLSEEIDSLAELLTKNPGLDAAGLPGVVPPDPKWQAVFGIKAEDKPGAGGMTLALEDGRFIVRTPATVIEDDPDHLLARWWIDGKPVPAAPMRQQQLQQARQQRSAREIAIPATLPTSIGAKVAAKVSLQVMYSIGGWQCPPSANDLAQQMQKLEQLHKQGLPPLLLSNKIDFVVTEKMLPATRLGK